MEMYSKDKLNIKRLVGFGRAIRTRALRFLVFFSA